MPYILVSALYQLRLSTHHSCSSLRMSIFEGSRSTIVNGGIFNATNATYHTTLARPSGELVIIDESFLPFEADAQRKGMDRLMEVVSPNAFYDSDNRADPPKCHPNTRIAVINKIIDWANGMIDTFIYS